MKTPTFCRWLLPAAFGVLAVAPAAAEIIILDGGQVASAQPDFAYQHPSLRSVVFVSQETRAMATIK